MQQAALHLTPSGHLRAATNFVDTTLGQRFSESSAAGLLHLVAHSHLEGEDATLSYWRKFAQEFLRTVAERASCESESERRDITSPPGFVAEWAESAPPFPGREYLTPALLDTIWSELTAAFQRDIDTNKQTPAEWLADFGAAWSLIGRICLHLAENRRDTQRPFAFMATVAMRVGGGGRVLFSPLARAIQDAEKEGNRGRVVALLDPLVKAGTKLPWLAQMVNNREIFHPVAFNPTEAFEFLKSIPAVEDAGIKTRVPNWWKSNASRVKTRVTVDRKDGTASGLGADALLSLNVSLAIGDEHLTQEEIKTLMRGNETFVQIRGTWVEIDREKLKSTLDHWKCIERSVTEKGLGWHQAMRLLAGARVEKSDLQFDGTTGSKELARWSDITCGSALIKTLENLRLQNNDNSARFEPGALLNASLRPYQSKGVAWLGMLRQLGLGSCLADDMGLGKTIQIIALLLCLKRDEGTCCSLLVVPASLIGNWLSEIEKFAPSLRATVAHPSYIKAAESGRRQKEGSGFSPLELWTKENLATFDLCITTYGQLTRSENLRKTTWNLAILDEAQAIKNPGTRQTNAAKELRARTRIALTGTPVENRLSDLWSLFDYLNSGLLGTFDEFQNFIARKSGELEEAKALRKITQPYILRRLKTDRSIVADLPDKTEITSWCNLSRDQIALYSASIKEFEQRLRTTSSKERRGLVLAYLTRFKQICNHPTQALGHGEFDGAASGKHQRLTELCEEIASRQEKVLIFTQYREMCRPIAGWLEAIFGSPGLVLDGSTQVTKRKGMVEQFQHEDGPPFFVLSLKAGGTGLNLTAASHVIHFDRWWNPAVENQATDRAYRIGQKRNVLVHKFVCRGTLEEHIDTMISAKRDLAEGVLGQEAEVPLTELSNEEILRLVRLDLGALETDE